MKNKRRWLLKALVMLPILFLVVAVSTAAVFAAADTYPSKPVKIVVPIVPGSSPDSVARLMAAKLTERLGKQVIVENHGGAGGVIGAEMVSKSAPDGYTIMIIAAFYPINAAIYNLPFDPVKSFTPIAKLGSGPSFLVAHPSLPANSIKELIAYAKAKPGQLIWATSGVGSNQHLAAELFKLKTGTDIKIVNFKGGGPAMTDVLGGHSQVATGTLSQMLPQIKSGKLKAIANCALKRSDILPDVPTASESGLPGYEVMGWWGFLAPAGTPAPVITRLNTEIKAILTSAEVKKLFQADGSEVDYDGPAEFGAYVKAEIDKWQRVVKEGNIKVEQ
jgi:tripartite-type tricarboxylate transporter receptor subunit TctC